jgi:defect in organelle trafficking protein DotD
LAEQEIIMKKHIFLMVLCGMAMTACQSQNGSFTDLSDMQKNDHVSISSDDAADPTAFVEARLSATARTVDQSMQRLASIESATHPQVAMPPPVDPATIAMAQKASVDWTGPVEPLIKKVAAASQYKLHILGAQPTVPTLVKINAKGQTLAQILRNLGYQIRHTANITIYPKRKIIELKYVTV